jgi:hypothetical protein
MKPEFVIKGDWLNIIWMGYVVGIRFRGGWMVTKPRKYQPISPDSKKVK